MIHRMDLTYIVEFKIVISQWVKTGAKLNKELRTILFVKIIS